MAAPVGATASIFGLTQFLNGLTAISNGFGSVGAAAGAVNAPIAGATAGFATFNQATTQTTKTVGAIGTAFGTVTAPIRGALNVIDEAGSRSVDALEGVASAAADLGTTGAAGLAIFGAAATTAFGAAIATAARFQREVVDLGAITQAPAQEIGQVTDAVRSMATQFATAIPDIQSASLELGRAGVPLDAVAKGGLQIALSLEQLSKGELTASAGAEALGSTLKLFFRDAQGSDEVVAAMLRIGNAVTAIGNETRATIPEVISAFVKAGPAFATTRQSVEDMAAAIGLLAGAGLRGQEAGTALSNFFLRLQNPSREAQKVLERFGVTTVDVSTGAMLPFGQILGDLIEKFGPYQRSIRGITDEEADWALGEIFQTRTLRATNIALIAGTESLQHYRDAIAGTDILAQAAQQNDALTRQVGILRNNVELGAIAFGLKFIPNIIAATREVNTFLASGERAQKVLEAIGTGALGVATGQGAVGGPQQETIRTTFGPEAAQSFSTITEQSQRALASIGATASAAGQLKDTLLQIAFPDGVDDLVIRLSDVFVRANEGAQGFLNFLTQIAPTAADAFGTAIRGTLDFLGHLKDITTSGLGAADVVDVFLRFVEVGRTAANEAGHIAEGVALVARAAIEARGEILGMVSAGIQAFSALAQAVLGVITLELRYLQLWGQIADVAGRVARNEPVGLDPNRMPTTTGPTLDLGNFGGRVPQRAENTADIDKLVTQIDDLRKTFDSTGASATTAFSQIGSGIDVLDRLVAAFRSGTTSTEQQQAALEDLTQILASGDLEQVGSFFGKDFVPQDAQDNLVEIKRLLEDLRTVTSPTEQETILGQITTESEHATASIGRQLTAMREARAASLAGGAGGAGGTADQNGIGRPRQDFNAAEREAERQAKLVEQARNRITEASEDADKNIRAAFRSLDSSLASIQQRVNDGLEAIATQFRDSFQDITENAQRQRAKLVESFDITQARGVITRNAQRTQEDERTNFERSLEDIRTRRQQQAETEEVIAQRSAEVQQRLATAEFARIAEVRQRGIDEANRVFSRGQEDALRIVTEGNERITLALSRSFDTTNTTRLQAREDTRRQEQLTRDLAKAKTEAERAGIRERFADETRALKERRSDEAEDTRIRLQQEDRMTAVRKSQELQVLNFRRAQEDVSVARRQAQEDEDLVFRFNQETLLDQFRQGLEDRARIRRRTATLQELLAARQEADQATQFSRDQAENFRTQITDVFSAEDLQRAIAESQADEGRAIQRSLQTADRARAQLFRTQGRETDSALRSFTETTQRIEERMGDIGTDVARSTNGAINSEFGAAFTALQIRLAAAQGQANVTVNDFIARLTGPGGLQESADRTLDGFLNDLQAIRDGAEGGTIVIRSLIQSPQGDRIIQLLEQVVRNTGAEPADQGPVIGNLTVTAPVEQAVRIGNAVADALQGAGAAG